MPKQGTPPATVRARRISPAQVPKTGSPAAMRFRSGSNSPSQQLAHDGALAAREDQPVQGAVQIPAPADLKVIRPQPVQHGGMLGKGALDR